MRADRSSTSLTMFEELPESLKGMKEFLTKADQFKRVPDPVVAVHCKVYALEKGLAERDKNDKSAMDFLLKLMDEVEREKSEIGPVDDAQMQVACQPFLCALSLHHSTCQLLLQRAEMGQTKWRESVGVVGVCEGLLC